MDRRYNITLKDLECMLCDETAEPKALPLSLLEEITNGFSDEQQIGSGGFAVVYKGKLENRVVAVKRMFNTYMYEKEFQREVECLMMVKHRNVVRFLGYCVDTQGSMARHEGKFIMADVQQRLLCFEYLPNGSLHEYITDTSSRLQWRHRYQIINGICQGLHYLHQNNIVHLDLKPGNILLDANLVAKIADFGLSRYFDDMQSRVKTMKIGGTLGYLAPEFGNGEITYQFDIYSLGVIIMEILTGKKGYHAVDKVVESWSKKLEKSQSDVQLKQVQVCAEIGIECIDSNPAKRPDAQRIMDRLNETKNMEEYTETGVITSQQAENVPNELHQDKDDVLDWLLEQAENVPNELHQDTPTPLGKTRNKIDPDMLIGTEHTLWLSYQKLNPDIRQCIEYCTIFPVGYMFVMADFVLMWIAQGFVKTSCATEDMEDVARGYVQDLVSCSYIKTHKLDNFSVDEQLHDILDKVARNCFRIENAEGWEGNIPQDVQHLFVDQYDAELITEKILGLENLRTLIIYFVKVGALVEEKVIESICKELPELRVLAFAFSEEDVAIKQDEFSIPESICQLKHLRYFAFRTEKGCKVILPSTLNKLQHIQVLDFGYGDISEFTFADLVNLRHIFCKVQLLKLPGFRVSNEQGCELKQLRNLNKLHGRLEISHLQTVRSKEEALEADLAAKERLTELYLSWDRSYGGRCSPEVEAEVLEGLCPPVGLEKLVIMEYRGSRYPDWMMGEQNGGPMVLQQLKLLTCNQWGPAPQLVEAFPHLRVLKFISCKFDALPCNMERLTSLKTLKIRACRSIRFIPTLPLSLEKFILESCDDDLMESCKHSGNPNWQNIQHIPDKQIRKLTGARYTHYL